MSTKLAWGAGTGVNSGGRWGGQAEGGVRAQREGGTLHTTDTGQTRGHNGRADTRRCKHRRHSDTRRRIHFAGGAPVESELEGARVVGGKALLQQARGGERAARGGNVGGERGWAAGSGRHGHCACGKQWIVQGCALHLSSPVLPCWCHKRGRPAGPYLRPVCCSRRPAAAAAPLQRWQHPPAPPARQAKSDGSWYQGARMLLPYLFWEAQGWETAKSAVRSLARAFCSSQPTCERRCTAPDHVPA